MRDASEQVGQASADNLLGVLSAELVEGRHDPTTRFKLTRLLARTAVSISVSLAVSSRPTG
jgi:hypothetical protein